MPTVDASGAPARALQTRMLEVDGRLLRVGVRAGDGNGPPLLIFNGIGANLELVEPFTSALDGIETIVFDVPGTGGSPAPLLPYRLWQLARLANRLLASLGHDGAVDVLGVSWGGALAQQFAWQYPRRCRRLVLAATSAGALMVPGRPRVLWRLLSPKRYGDADHLARIGSHLYGGVLRRQPERLRRHTAHIRPPRGRGYVYQLLAACGWTSLPWLALIRQPTLVLAGRDDPIVPLVNARVLAALLRQARLHVVDDGHLLLVTSAERVAPVVRAFLA